ncbi:hypothetical protein LINPERPRIM_LOCUS4352 [Linum perenne]
MGCSVMKTKPAEDGSCFHRNVKGHWKRNCPKYLEGIVKTQVRPNYPTRAPQPKGKKLKGANEDECFHCKVKGHWKRNCPKYHELAKTKRSKASTSGANWMNGAQEGLTNWFSESRS